jgi:hypothetical protein
MKKTKQQLDKVLQQRSELSSDECLSVKPLPPENNYTLIGKPTQLSESDWEGIVESVLYPMTNDIMGYENYGDRLFSCCETATESGLSWIKSLNLDPDKVVILKIEK